MANYDTLTEQDLVSIRKFIDTAQNGASDVSNPDAPVSISEVFNEKGRRMTQDKKGNWVAAPEIPKLFDAKGNLVTKDKNGNFVPIADSKGNPLGISANGSTMIPQNKVLSDGKEIKNAGEVDWSGLAGAWNKVKNATRQPIREAANAVSPGSTRFFDTISDLKSGQVPADNLINRTLSDTIKGLKRGLSGAGTGEPVTPEDKAMAFLNDKFPAQPFPKATGVRKYAGIGEFKTPYGRFHIDESGTLRKL